MLRNSSGYVALHVASRKGRAGCLSLLLSSYGAEHVDITTADTGETCLHLAAHRDRAGSIAVLVAAGAEIDARSTREWTALHVGGLVGVWW